MNKDEALRMAIGIAEKAIKHWKNNIDDLDAKQWEKIDKYEDKLYDLKEALEQPAQEPLSDDEIARIFFDNHDNYLNYARAIEQAHGIV